MEGAQKRTLEAVCFCLRIKAWLDQVAAFQEVTPELLFAVAAVVFDTVAAAVASYGVAAVFVVVVDVQIAVVVAASHAVVFVCVVKMVVWKDGSSSRRPL